MHMRPFDRLVEAVDRAAGAQGIPNVFIQTGFARYRPQHCQWAPAIDFSEFKQRMQEAQVVITHGGAGCIADALETGRAIIAMPRLQKYGEHADDHQLELTSVLEQSGRILLARDGDDLSPLIKKARSFVPAPASGENRIAELVRGYLLQVAQKQGRSPP
jgi:UDP-N-acetylglucosamine transferase subunit ALG13